jgi:N-acyl-L-homoserine lactone synthetase
MKRSLLLFRNTREVIKAERILLRYGVAVRVIPVPRSISSECGMALHIPQADRDHCLSLLEAEDVHARAHDDV